jgi:large subunit ribosomal protein L5
MGVSEQTIFPEIDAAAVEWPQGMNITVVTSARSDRECRELLRRIGMPFRTDKAAEAKKAS